MHNKIRIGVRIAPVGFLSCLLSGCLSGVSMGDITIRPEVGDYRRLAVIGGLGAEAEERFKAMFEEAFPGMEIVDRGELLQIVSADSLRAGRLSPDARDRVRRTLSVQGIVVLAMEDSGFGGTLDWQMTILSAETGETTGTLVARVRRDPLARGVPFSDLEQRAFEGLISAMQEQLWPEGGFG